MKTTERASRSFEYQCKKALKCRNDRCQPTCYGCKFFESCEILRSIDRAKSTMRKAGLIM